MEKNKIIAPCLPYTYRRTVLAVQRLCERYPEIIRKLPSGRSEQGRDIPVISLGRGHKKTLAVGAVHGREYVTVGFLLRCAEEYACAYRSGISYGGFDVGEIFEENTIHLVPIANPDSVEIALGRALPEHPAIDHCAYTYKNNSNNINLNANFPYMWERVPPCRQGGRACASEAETRFLMDICEGGQYEGMLSFHSRGDCLYWRDFGSGEVAGDEKLAQTLRRLCGFTLCDPTENPEDFAGGFENWFRYRYKKPAVCVELVKDGNAPFDLCCRHFDDYTRWEHTRYALLGLMTAL